MRTQAEFWRIRTYIEKDPLREDAGRISFIPRGVEKNLDAARTSACATLSDQEF